MFGEKKEGREREVGEKRRILKGEKQSGVGGCLEGRCDHANAKRLAGCADVCLCLAAWDLAREPPIQLHARVHLTPLNLQ